jgi:hypothetical protein
LNVQKATRCETNVKALYSLSFDEVKIERCVSTLLNVLSVGISEDIYLVALYFWCWKNYTFLEATSVMFIWMEDDYSEVGFSCNSL